jgi:hypothetical protein
VHQVHIPLPASQRAELGRLPTRVCLRCREAYVPEALRNAPEWAESGSLESIRNYVGLLLDTRRIDGNSCNAGRTDYSNQYKQGHGV